MLKGWLAMGGRAPRPSLPEVLQPLKFREYRLLWSGATVSQAGTWMQTLALGWLAVQLAGADHRPQLTGLYVGLVVGSRSLPGLVVSAIAGAVADRHDRRRLLLVANLAGAVVTAILAGLVLSGHITILLAGLLSGVGAIGALFDGAARMATLPRLVPRSYLSPAVGLNLATVNLATFAGPLLGGVLIGPFGVGGLLALNAASFSFIIVALLLMKPIPVESTGGQGMIDAVKEGFGYVSRQPVIRATFGMMAIVALTARPLQQLLPAVTKDSLHAGPIELSWLLAASGAGAVVGSVAGPYFARFARIGVSTALAASAFGVLTLLFALQRWLPLALLLVAAASIGQASHVVLHMTIYQMRTPDALRGRVVSASMMIPVTLAPLGALLLGSLSSVVGIGNALFAGGALAALSGLLVLAMSPALRAATLAHGQDTMRAHPGVVIPRPMAGVAEQPAPAP